MANTIDTKHMTQDILYTMWSGLDGVPLGGGISMRRTSLARGARVTGVAGVIMSTKREHHRQQKREKQKAKQKAKRKEGKASRPGAGDPRDRRGGSLATAVGWTAGTAYLSANWSERGALVHAVFTRNRADGRIAAAFFEVDLAERGVIAVKSGTSYNEARILAEVGRRSEPVAMMEADPGLVAKLVHEGHRWGVSQGHEPPRGLDEALALMADMDPENYPTKIPCGREEPPKRRSGGLLTAIKGWFTRGDAAPAPAEGATAPGGGAPTPVGEAGGGEGDRTGETPAGGSG